MTQISYVVIVFLSFVLTDGIYAAEKYDATARNFTADCHEYAIMGRDYCQTFMRCCSTDGLLNKFRGDKCKRIDPKNGCKELRKGVVTTIQCKAYDCTEEINPKYANSTGNYVRPTRSIDIITITSITTFYATHLIR